ncbi:hypothetical protein BD289DRAFT_270965 [Coniella lustricola]|uniref:Uncharacterized protein n=1 Tax=Coniella lustricola TaxID=2025994 RepID=A0A2T3AKF8_9PEZI|nr:hypothetical protein BD289DRAFT_270965 [Coniella lustricola]
MNGNSRVSATLDYQCVAANLALGNCFFFTEDVYSRASLLLTSLCCTAQHTVQRRVIMALASIIDWLVGSKCPLKRQTVTQVDWLGDHRLAARDSKSKNKIQRFRSSRARQRSGRGTRETYSDSRNTARRCCISCASLVFPLTQGRRVLSQEWPSGMVNVLATAPESPAMDSECSLDTSSCWQSGLSKLSIQSR